MASSALSPQLVNGVYVPSALLIMGTFIVKKEWLPYAVALAAVLGGLKAFVSQRPARAIQVLEQVKEKVPAPVAEKVVEPIEDKVLHKELFREFILTEKTIVSHNVAIYRFALPKPTDILGLPIGQHISLAATIPGQPNEVVRSYTPISSDEDIGHFDLLLKAYPQGNISAHMAALEVGQTMKVRGPKGAMVYTPNMCRRIGMIAGGTGITPMLQIIRAIERGRPKNGGNDTTQVDLIFANVNPDDILLKDDLDRLAREDEGINVHYVLNNPPEGWTGGVGFVTADMIKEHLPPPAADIKVLICGPPPMVKAMKTATESLGYTKARPVSKLEDQVFCF